MKTALHIVLALGLLCGSAWAQGRSIGFGIVVPVASAGGPPTGACGGDLGSTYPNCSVIGLNGTLLSGLATGPLFNTTGTGVPKIGIFGTDLPGLAATNNWTAANTFAGLLNSTQNGALSQAAVTITGLPVATGGTATTTFPLWYFNESGTAVTTWATTGTIVGFNCPSGATGNVFDIHLNGGASVFKLGCNGNVTAAAVTATSFSGPVTGAHTGVDNGSETVTFSATPTFSNSIRDSVITLTAAITSFTLAATNAGTEKSLTFCMGATAFAVTAPANVHGFMSLTGTSTPNKCSTQNFVYNTVQVAWLAVSPGVLNQ